MTPLEWSAVKDRVTFLWGSNTKWTHAAKLTSDVASIPQRAAMTTIEDFIGRTHPPSPADIIHGARTQLIGGPPLRTAPGPEDCNHPQYGIIEYMDDGRRRGQCRICYMERVFPIGGLLMDWEIEEQRLATQEIAP